MSNDKNQKYKITDTENKEVFFKNDDELIEFLNKQFDLMKFEKLNKEKAFYVYYAYWDKYELKETFNSLSLAHTFIKGDLDHHNLSCDSSEHNLETLFYSVDKGKNYLTQALVIEDSNLEEFKKIIEKAERENALYNLKYCDKVGLIDDSKTYYFQDKVTNFKSKNYGLYGVALMRFADEKDIIYVKEENVTIIKEVSKK